MTMIGCWEYIVVEICHWRGTVACRLAHETGRFNRKKFYNQYIELRIIMQERM